MNGIAIVGAGWLGKPLAQALIASGQSVVVSKSSAEGVTALSALSIPACLFDVRKPDIPSEILTAKTLILNIAFRKTQLTGSAYREAILRLLSQAKISDVQRVLFVSTTSVYGVADGVVDEQSPLNPSTESAQAHLEIESALAADWGNRGAVLRLAGLVGGKRHPINQLAGRTGLKHPQHPVNLVHRDDVIMAIEKILQQPVWGQTFLLCATEHPSRQQYYQWAAETLGKPQPEFVTEGTTQGKRIDATWTLKTLGLTLKYASPYSMLSATALCE